MPEEKEYSISEALNFAIEAHKKGNAQRAEFIYKKILEKFPNQQDALHLLGLIEHQKGNHFRAVEKIKSAIAISPNALFYFNLANIYDFLKEDEKSAENYQKALELNPNHQNAYLSNYNLGVYFKDNGDIERALFYYNKSLELNPNFSEAHWNKSLILLLLENFKEGFEEYEYRFKKTNPTDARIFQKPKLEDLENLKDKKILILSEQGFGDAIQFVRYISLLKQKGAYIILECKKELIELFKSSPEIDADEIIEKQSGIPQIEHDYYIHLMSLPKLFQTDLLNIPNRRTYLKADENLIKKFKEQINELSSNKLKVGICWHGNPLQENDKNRSTTFEKFKVLEDISDVQIFSLQKNISPEELNQLTNSRIINLESKINNFADAAAIIENLDLIISVDTSIAHLSGALSKPCWTLLTKTPDWRWLLNRNDNPWYPSMKLFRQENFGDWDGLIKKAKEELKEQIKQNCWN